MSDTEVLGVRMTVERIEEIERRAEGLGITKSEFVRNAVARKLGEELLKDRVARLEEKVFGDD